MILHHNSGNIKFDPSYFRIISPAETVDTSFLKACAVIFLSNFYFSSNDSPSKTMKNVF